ncbi:MAG: hypothetical protein Q4P18_08185 [Methanobrevibacter sp.]|uniref:hypothetical protein n=1 Tax=Methanobrevibacter sp. TaxID=66852 RepID=UPI0026DEA9CA|nr:hypothetical protein [Methanobrevibacter sp.]MDO5849500.1 hypothetical protein [Methanobrevibacter sp.]
MVKKNHYYDEDDEDFETCPGMDTGIVGRQITDLDEFREMCRKDAEEDRRRGIEPTSSNFDT